MSTTPISDTWLILLRLMGRLGGLLPSYLISNNCVAGPRAAHRFIFSNGRVPRGPVSNTPSTSDSVCLAVHLVELSNLNLSSSSSAAPVHGRRDWTSRLFSVVFFVFAAIERSQRQSRTAQIGKHTGPFDWKLARLLTGALCMFEK